MKGKLTAAIMAAVWLGSAGSTRAADPEQSCQAALAKAAGKYVNCIQGQVSKFYGGGSGSPWKCVTKYAATYDKLQAKAQASAGSETCDAARFVDNGNWTVTDNLTALQWEKKTDDSTVHDKDNFYSWSALGTAADGTAFATFLSALNGAAFSGQYDWRMPTLAELLSITQPALPNCTSPPCIDATFGLTQSTNYWSSSTGHYLPSTVWQVSFGDGYPAAVGKTGGSYVRAVRGGY